MNKKQKSLLLIILSALIGAFFIASAWLKTRPNFQFFEYTIQNQIGLPDTLSAWAARFFVGFEAALGVMLLLNVFGKKKWVLKACMALLAIFSVHLIWLWISRGKDADCGCMGELVPMSSWLSLLKNIALMFLAGVVWKHAEEDKNKLNHWLSIIVSLVLIAVPYIIFPVQNYPLPVSSLYIQDQPEQPKIDLKSGKHIVCFMTLTCPHCRDAATIIEEIHQQNSDFPFYIFFPNDSEDTLQEMKLLDFKKDTKVVGIPYSFINRETFIEMMKAVGEDGVPVMLWTKDSSVVRKMNIPDLQKTEAITKEIATWLQSN